MCGKKINHPNYLGVTQNYLGDDDHKYTYTNFAIYTFGINFALMFVKKSLFYLFSINIQVCIYKYTIYSI